MQLVFHRSIMQLGIPLFYHAAMLPGLLIIADGYQKDLPPILFQTFAIIFFFHLRNCSYRRMIPF